MLGDQILVGGGGWRPGFPKEGAYGWNLFLEEEGPGGPDSYVLKREALRVGLQGPRQPGTEEQIPGSLQGERLGVLSPGFSL